MGCFYINVCVYIYTNTHISISIYLSIYLPIYLSIYLSIDILCVFNKNNNNWLLHCVSLINLHFQMAKIYLVFLRKKNIYIKVNIKLLIK